MNNEEALAAIRELTEDTMEEDGHAPSEYEISRRTGVTFEIITRLYDAGAIKCVPTVFGWQTVKNHRRRPDVVTTKFTRGYVVVIVEQSSLNKKAVLPRSTSPTNYSKLENDMNNKEALETIRALTEELGRAPMESELSKATDVTLSNVTHLEEGGFITFISEVRRFRGGLETSDTAPSFERVFMIVIVD